MEGSEGAYPPFMTSILAAKPQRALFDGAPPRAAGDGGRVGRGPGSGPAHPGHGGPGCGTAVAGQAKAAADRGAGREGQDHFLPES